MLSPFKDLYYQYAAAQEAASCVGDIAEQRSNARLDAILTQLVSEEAVIEMILRNKIKQVREDVVATGLVLGSGYELTSEFVDAFLDYADDMRTTGKGTFPVEFYYADDEGGEELLIEKEDMDELNIRLGVHEMLILSTRND